MPTVATPDHQAHGFISFIIETQAINEASINKYILAAKKASLSLVSYLAINNIINSEQLAADASEYFGLPYLDINAVDLVSLPLKTLNESLIRKHNTLPLFVRGKTLFLAFSDPCQPVALDEIQFHSQLHPQIIIVEESKLAKAIEICLEASDTSMAELIEVQTDNYGESTPYADIATNNSEIDDAPIVRFVNKILSDAIKKGASDIHLEPYEKEFRIRFRTDGMLYQIPSPPSAMANRIISRLKVMAKMDISEHRIPQDGRIKITLTKTNPIDFRVNCCPTLFGEKMVLRILDSNNAQIGIEKLGFEQEQEQLFKSAINKPYGMILVTGPTGSGKTVTLYTALNILNRIEQNICTAEDPVEISVSGINQVNINVKTGLTFATALRSFLRQDPDIIMVGEIRDLETADIAVKAAQTGHLVLSTLHTNDAPQTLNRLMQMGIEPYNIASAIILIIAQRLARRLCPLCKKQVNYPKSLLISAGFALEDIETLKLYEAIGCDHCITGYKGRIGIYQTMTLSDPMRNLILEGGNAEQITNLADQEGIKNLRASGLYKVKMGITSLEEVDRVTKE